MISALQIVNLIPRLSINVGAEQYQMLEHASNFILHVYHNLQDTHPCMWLAECQRLILANGGFQCTGHTLWCWSYPAQAQITSSPVSNLLSFLIIPMVIGRMNAMISNACTYI